MDIVDAVLADLAARVDIGLAVFVDLDPVVVVFGGQHNAMFVVVDFFVQGVRLATGVNKLEEAGANFCGYFGGGCEQDPAIHFPLLEEGLSGEEGALLHWCAYFTVQFSHVL